MVPLYGRRPGEDSDSEFRDSSSDGSSDCEPERGLKYVHEQRSHHNPSTEIPHRMDSLSLREYLAVINEDFSSDEGESVHSQGCLRFEYLERDLPYSREPLADKVSNHPHLFFFTKTKIGNKKSFHIYVCMLSPFLSLLLIISVGTDSRSCLRFS
jgi:hypothetical protein